MHLDEFSYDLPDALIAQNPREQRSTSRLMAVDRASGAVREHATFSQLATFLDPGDVLVVNRSRVVPARLLLHRADGATFEVLFVRTVGERRMAAWAKPMRKLAPGDILNAGDGVALRFVARSGEREALFDVDGPDDVTVEALLEQFGHMPLPPYIRRPDTSGDRERYQTVFARDPGSIAAPTAGLHFDNDLIEGLRSREVTVCSVVLHVGPGTFAPLENDVIEDNKLSAESFTIDAADRRILVDAVREGRRIVAVGTTVTRALETAWARGWLSAGSDMCGGETDLFIYPGYTFQAVGGLVTNFHLPRSSLLLLVCAFLGTGSALACYREAVARAYRFYSYGDAMIIL